MNESPDSGPAIETVGLTRRFGETLAVDDLSLRIERGTTFGLIGPNGAGKSTTIKMLMGLLPPTTGTVKVLGLDPFGRNPLDGSLDGPLEVRQRVGYVPELHHIDRWMRVHEVVAFCRALYRNWNDEVCGRLLETYTIERNKKVKQLSKGTLVKLSLALAVSHEPELLILDEPMAGLDPLAREEFLDGVLRTICDGGQTVLISTHSLDDVQRLADTVGLLYNGRLLFHRQVQDVLASTKRIRATLSGDGPLSDDRTAAGDILGAGATLGTGSVASSGVGAGIPSSAAGIPLAGEGAGAGKSDAAGAGSPADAVPGVIWQRVEGRLWELTIGDFRPEIVEQLRQRQGIEHVEVVDIGLEDLFKDIVKGQRGMR